MGAGIQAGIRLDIRRELDVAIRLRVAEVRRGVDLVERRVRVEWRRAGIELRLALWRAIADRRVPMPVTWELAKVAR